MPAIVVKDYEWRQTNENVIIYVQLVGNPMKVDFLTSDKYVKASYPPYILELFLWGFVNEEESKCTLSKEQAIISLKKKEIGFEWKKLEVEDLSKDFKQEYRKQALEHSHFLAEQRAKSRSEKLRELEKQAVRAQIDLDTLSLNKIEMIRDFHRKKAMKELEEWRLNVENPMFDGIEGIKQENRKAYKPAIKWFKDDFGELKSKEISHEEILKEETTATNSKPQYSKKLSSKNTDVEESPTKKKIAQPSKGALDHENECQEAKSSKESSTKTSNSKSEYILENKTSSADSESDIQHENYFNNHKNGCLIKELDEKQLHKFCKKKDHVLKRNKQDIIQRFLNKKPHTLNKIFDDPKKSLPLPRKCGTIRVAFSERVFPTPARESSHIQEQEWLEKQAEARRKTGFVSEDLRPEEQNPQWLKDKGDDFFKTANYLGAISAYSHGIKLSGKMSSLYVNRSAAHYALGNYYKCTEDCSKAIELMVPECESNRESRARCHARRGAALCKLSAPQHGIPELEAALRLVPDNESIKRDLVAAKKYFQLEN